MKLQNLTSSRIIGYCPWSEQRIISELNSGTRPSSFPGDFVFVAEGKNPDNEPYTALLTSVISASPYFYLVHSEQFFHGESIFDIVKASGVAWEWNSQAVNCLAILDHLIGDDTLHKRIKRVDSSSIYYFSRKKLSVDSDIGQFLRTHRNQVVSVDEAVSTVRSITGEMLADREVAISLSAGYDSRALLAMALDLGYKPLISTMGPPDATDVLVAKSMCRRFGLRHEHVELSEAEYYQSALDIIRITSGTKPFLHWHTYLHAKHTKFPEQYLHLVGANGEFVRTFYLDKGSISWLADQGPDDLTTRMFFRAKYGLQRRLPGYRIRTFLQADESFRASQVPELRADVCKDIQGFLDKLDWFYAFHRVRHFIGNGLSLYRSFNQTSSPFLDSRFIACGLGLSRSTKMNSRFHRTLIRHCMPELLDFSVDDSSTPMREREQPLYWLRRHSVKGYNPVPDIVQSEKTREIIMESTNLDLFMSSAQRLELLEANKSVFLAFLITMHFLVELLREEGVT